MKKRLFKFGLAAIAAGAIMVCAPAAMAAHIDGGSLTDTATWSLDTDDTTGSYTLTISGTGEVSFSSSDAPWSSSNDSIVRAVIEEGITNVPSEAFSSCSSLKEVEIPNTVTSLGMHAFTNSGLTSVVLPSSLESVGNYAFYDCTNLSSVTISEGISTIGDYMFQSCKSLKEVEIPNTVTSLGRCAFNRSGLTSVVLPSSLTLVRSDAFSSCSDLSSVTISEGITSIGSYMFYDCSSLKEVEIPNTVTFLGSYAFSRSGLTSVVLPSSLTRVGDEAFNSCQSLEMITYNGSREAFNNISNISYSGIDSTKVYFARPDAEEVAFDISTATVNTDAKAYMVNEKVNIQNPVWNVTVTKDEKSETVPIKTDVESIQGNVVWGAVIYNLKGAEITSVTLEGGNV